MSKIKTTENKTKDTERIAERLRKLRFENSLTQEKVAEMLGVTQQTYSKYEKEGNLDGKAIIKLCEFYGVSADYLLGIEQSKTIVEEKKMSYDISEHDIDIIAKVINIIEEKNKNTKK